MARNICARIASARCAGYPGSWHNWYGWSVRNSGHIGCLGAYLEKTPEPGRSESLFLPPIQADPDGRGIQKLYPGSLEHLVTHWATISTAALWIQQFSESSKEMKHDPPQHPETYRHPQGWTINRSGLSDFFYAPKRISFASFAMPPLRPCGALRRLGVRWKSATPTTSAGAGLEGNRYFTKTQAWQGRSQEYHQKLLILR